MADPTDSQVLKRVQQGDYRAYVLIFDRYYAAIERYAVCLLGEGEAASAAASATFEKGFREARRKGATTAGYPARLFLLCRRSALRTAPRQIARKLSRRPEPAPEVSGPASLDDLPLSIILCGERDALVLSALNELAPPDREIIHLAFEPVLFRKDLGAILTLPSDQAVTAQLIGALRRLGAAVLRSGYAPARTGRPSPYVQRPART